MPHDGLKLQLFLMQLYNSFTQPNRNYTYDYYYIIGFSFSFYYFIWLNKNIKNGKIFLRISNGNERIFIIILSEVVELP